VLHPVAEAPEAHVCVCSEIVAAIACMLHTVRSISWLPLQMLLLPRVLLLLANQLHTMKLTAFHFVSSGKLNR
jgi:hypothetical protein